MRMPPPELPPGTFRPQDTSAWRKHYDEHGYAILRGLLESERVDLARKACSDLIDELAERLVREGRTQMACGDLPLETRLMELCKTCPESLPNLFRAELHRPELFEVRCAMEFA